MNRTNKAFSCCSLLLLLAAAPSTSQAANGEGYSLQIKSDPLDDHTEAFVIFGGKDRFVAVGCSDVRKRDSLQVVVHYDTYIDRSSVGMLAGGTSLEYRVDQRPAQQVWWAGAGTDIIATLPDTKPMKFIQSMRGSQKLYLRATDFNGTYKDMSFTYGTPDLAIDDVLARCGYQPNGRSAKKG